MKPYEWIALVVVIVALYLGYALFCDQWPLERRPAPAVWIVRMVPTTAEERVKVDAYAIKYQAERLTRRDRPWSLTEARAFAELALCRPTLWEYRGDRATGRWRYVNDTVIHTVEAAAP